MGEVFWGAKMDSLPKPTTLPGEIEVTSLTVPFLPEGDVLDARRTQAAGSVVTWRILAWVPQSETVCVTCL